MAWDVEFTGQFETWWNSLSEDEQVEISAKVELLQVRGPTLRRPHVLTWYPYSPPRRIMKAWRGNVDNRHLRVRYALNPQDVRRSSCRGR